TSDLYYRAARQAAFLERGQVQYKLIDSGFRTDVASNCIHAVSSIVDGFRLRVFSPSYGETASYYITRRLLPWIIDPNQKHDWILTLLGLDGYPLIHRELENPRSGLFWSTLRAGRAD